MSSKYDKTHNLCYEECIDRNYLYKNSELKIKLAKLNDEVKHYKIPNNIQEKKYSKTFYGSFHKGLAHDLTTGSLINQKDYKKLVKSIQNNNQKCLAKVPLYPNSTSKFVDPLVSLSTPLLGPDYDFYKLPEPPTLFSASGAAEMIELYAKALSRDVPFIDYDSNITISNVLGYMNTSDVLNNLPDYSPRGSITSNTIFRGPFTNCQLGPYISQLLYLNIPLGNLTVQQLFEVYPTKDYALLNNLTVEWGTSSNDMINIQNGILTGLPPIPSRNNLLNKYVFNGRCLAENVHNDAGYQFFYSAALILQGLGASINPGFPVYPNQTYFASNSGGPSILCALAGVFEITMRHVWFWKWQVYRKLRPEEFSIYIDNVMNGRVSNDEYNIAPFIFNNNILGDVASANAQWGATNSYTLSSCYREASPGHPSYTSGHASYTGACAHYFEIIFSRRKFMERFAGFEWKH